MVCSVSVLPFENCHSDFELICACQFPFAAQVLSPDPVRSMVDLRTVQLVRPYKHARAVNAAPGAILSGAARADIWPSKALTKIGYNLFNRHSGHILCVFLIAATFPLQNDIILLNYCVKPPVFCVPTLYAFHNAQTQWITHVIRLHNIASLGNWHISMLALKPH